MYDTTTMRAVAALAAVLLVLGPAATAGALDHREDAIDGAERLLDVQFESGAFPWLVGSPGEYQNVQGVTAVALLDAYTLTLDQRYLDGAQDTVDWLFDYYHADAENRFSSGSFFFLAKHWLVTGNQTALTLANQALDRTIAEYGSMTAYADHVIEVRANSQWTNLGFWDVGLIIRATQDIGHEEEADAMASLLADHVATVPYADPLDDEANVYLLGLTGLAIGMSESDAWSHQAIVREAVDRIKTRQCNDGSLAETWNGEKYCGDIQATAYAVIGLTYALATPLEAWEACDFLAANQASDGGWDLGGYEIAEVDAEATSALVQCALPLHNGATAYANAIVPGV